MFENVWIGYVFVCNGSYFTVVKYGTLLMLVMYSGIGYVRFDVIHYIVTSGYDMLALLMWNLCCVSVFSLVSMIIRQCYDEFLLNITMLM